MAVSMAGAYVRKAAHHSAESGSALLSVDGRKSREAGVQPRGSKSAKARLVTAAERRCQVRNTQRTASWPSAWQVRTSKKQPITMQKAVPPCSVSADGRVEEPKRNQGARNRWRPSPAYRHCPEAWAGHLDHCGSNRIAKTVVCGGHQVVASSTARGRLRAREGHRNSGSP